LFLWNWKSFTESLLVSSSFLCLISFMPWSCGRFRTERKQREAFIAFCRASVPARNYALTAHSSQSIEPLLEQWCWHTDWREIKAQDYKRFAIFTDTHSTSRYEYDYFTEQQHAIIISLISF
jgi:hypothetical protein